MNTWLLLPLGLAVLTYVRALGGDFVWDDEIYLKRSSLYASSLREILFPPMLSGDVPYYRPTANLGGLVLFRLSGGQIPWLWHAATVLLHAVTTAGVYMLLRAWVTDDGDASRKGRAQTAAVAGATLFACWPANAEAVTWVSASTEGIMVCCLVWAVALHLRARDSGRSALPSAVFFLLALGAKETAIAFVPIAIAATALLPPSRGAVKTGWKAGLASSLWLPHLLAYATYTALRLLALGRTSGNSLTQIAAQRLTLDAFEPAVRAWSYYLREALLLGPGGPFTEYPPAGLASLLLGIAGVVAGTAVIAMAYRRSWRPWSMVVVWFVLALGPPIAMAVDPLSVTAVAIRYLYAANVAVAAVAALVVVRLPDFGARQRTVLAVAGIGVVALVGLTQVRMNPWLTRVGLWGRAVEDHPRSTVARLNLGLALVGQERFAEGEEHLRHAAYGTKGTVGWQQTALVRLGEFYVMRGQVAPARAALLKASRLAGTRDGVSSAMTLAAALEMLEDKASDSEVNSIPRNRLVQQVAALEHAAQLSPFDPTPLLILAIVHEALGEKERARGAYLSVAAVAVSNQGTRSVAIARAERLTAEIAAEADPVKRLYFEAQRHEVAKEWEDAARSYEAALEIASERTDLMMPLAEIHARQGNVTRAEELMVRATELDPSNPFMWFNLGLYRSLAKKWAEASDAFLRASTLLPGWWRPYLHRASALEGMGDLEGAVEQYENMLEVYEGAEGIRGHAVERIRVLRLARGRNPSPPESERPFSAPP